ncbi:MAG: aldehyde dehydrogenase family protein, partial [Pseudoxanthomonas sp.]|nr:aldehyde dehydrogenase family protein [Pseudoxanthomonas sp.]
MTRQLHHHIGGREQAGRSGRHGEVFDPASGQVAAQVPLADAGEVRAVVDAAQAAFPAWAATPPVQRARVMFRLRALVERDAEALARTITAEHGKTLSDARGEVTRGLEVVEFASGIPHLLKGEYSAEVGRGVDSWSERSPLGVVACSEWIVARARSP